MVGAALEEGPDVVHHKVVGSMWGVPYFGEAGAPISVPDTVSFEGAPAYSSPAGGFVGRVGVATSGVLVLGAAAVF